jgi:hypothetical protein
MSPSPLCPSDRPTGGFDVWDPASPERFICSAFFPRVIPLTRYSVCTAKQVRSQLVPEVYLWSQPRAAEESRDRVPRYALGSTQRQLRKSVATAKFHSGILCSNWNSSSCPLVIVAVPQPPYLDSQPLTLECPCVDTGSLTGRVCIPVNASFPQQYPL